MKDIKLLISSLLIVVSFFLWYYFSSVKYELKLQERDAERFSVEIDTSKDAINIVKSSERIDVVVDGEER